MKCPKCHSPMQTHSLETNAGTVSVDQCTRCKGIWFDSGEAEILKEEWRSLFLDTGDPKIGQIYNEIKDIDCPRCHQPMHHQKDVRQNHIEYEVCMEHGVFMDAGEFADYKVISVIESVQNLMKHLKNKSNKNQMTNKNSGVNMDCPKCSNNMAEHSVDIHFPAR